MQTQSIYVYKIEYLWMHEIYFNQFFLKGSEVILLTNVKCIYIKKKLLQAFINYIRNFHYLNIK